MSESKRPQGQEWVGKWIKCTYGASYRISQVTHWWPAEGVRTCGMFDTNLGFIDESEVIEWR